MPVRTRSRAPDKPPNILGYGRGSGGLLLGEIDRSLTKAGTLRALGENQAYLGAHVESRPFVDPVNLWRPQVSTRWSIPALTTYTESIAKVVVRRVSEVTRNSRVEFLQMRLRPDAPLLEFLGTLDST